MKSQAVSCKYCLKVLAGTTTRMECHLKSCVTFKEMRRGDPRAEATFKEALSSKAWKSSPRKGPSGRGGKRGMTGKGRGGKRSKAEKLDQEKASNYFAKALMANMLPVDIFYTSDWQEFMKYVAPGFKLPEKEVLTSKYLFGLQQKLNTDVITAIVDCTALGFVFNKFIYNEATQQHACNRMVCTPYPFYWGSYRFSAIEPQSVKKAFVELVEELSVSFKIANRHVPRIWGMCLSHPELATAANMLTTRDELPKGLLTYGCAIVGLEKFGALLMKASEIAEVVRKAGVVAADILGSTQLQEAFKQNQEKVFKGHLRLPKTSDTDWCSHYFLLLALKMNQPVFQRLLQDKASELSKEAIAVLKDEVFWSAASCVVALFKTVKDVLDIIRCDGHPISFVTAAFLYIKSAMGRIISGDSQELKSLLGGSKTASLKGCAEAFKQSVDKMLDECWSGTDGPPLALSFTLDPLFCAWRKTLQEENMQLGGKGVVESASSALQRLIKAEIYPETAPSSSSTASILDEYTAWLETSHTRSFPAAFHPKSFWGFEAGARPGLSMVGFDLFSFPACDISAEPPVISLYGNAMAKSKAPNSNARAGIPYNSQKLQIREKLMKKSREQDILKFFTDIQFIRPEEMTSQFVMENLDVIYDVEIDDLNGDNMSDFKGIPRLATPLNSRGIPAATIPAPPKESSSSQPAFDLQQQQQPQFPPNPPPPEDSSLLAV